MIRRPGWIPWVSWRFLTGRRGGRGRLIFLFAVILIGSGVATLNTILAVMNGLQQGYIRSILEIGSYHLRWTPDFEEDDGTKAQDDSEAVLDIVSGNPRIAVALPFIEGQTMLNGVRPRPAGALVRGVPENLYEIDGTMAKHLELEEGSFDLSGGGIVLGSGLSMILGADVGDKITALELGSAGFSPAQAALEVTGIFRCSYREYEMSLAFVSLDTARSLYGNVPAEVGIKLVHADRDRRAAEELSESFNASGIGGSLSSWRDNNRSFFGALRTEKVMMILLLALIFVVVAVNIDHSLRRMATERTEDLAILKSHGASPGDIRILFLRHGLVIGGAGGLFGSLAGVLIGANVDGIIRGFHQLWNMLAGLLGLSSFHPLPVEAFLRSTEVMPKDVLIIFSLAVALSSAAAIRAASLAARLKPAEVLRSE